MTAVEQAHPPFSVANLQSPVFGYSCFMKFLKALSIFIVFILASCTTIPTDAPTFTTAPAAPDGYATVYFYRLGAQPYGKELRVNVNGRRVLEMPESAYTYMYVKAGTHTILTDWYNPPLAPLPYSSAVFTLDAKAGETYYLRQVTDTSIAPSSFFGPTLFSHRSAIISLAAARGSSELKACCRLMPSAQLRIE